MTKTISLHGVLMRIEDMGVLISGPSGIGKSEAALALVERGGQLVADDAPLFTLEKSTLLGRSSALLQNKLQVHGLGVLDIAQLYGADAICQQTSLELIISLSDQPQPKSLKPDQKLRRVLSLDIPEITLPINQPRDSALLIHCAVRTYLTAKKGYNAALTIEQT